MRMDPRQTKRCGAGVREAQEHIPSTTTDVSLARAGTLPSAWGLRGGRSYSVEPAWLRIMPVFGIGAPWDAPQPRASCRCRECWTTLPPVPMVPMSCRLHRCAADSTARISLFYPISRCLTFLEGRKRTPHRTYPHSCHTLNLFGCL